LDHHHYLSRLHSGHGAILASTNWIKFIGRQQHSFKGPLGYDHSWPEQFLVMLGYIKYSSVPRRGSVPGLNSVRTERALSNPQHWSNWKKNQCENI
jgi:hypothetical protein